MDAAEASPGTKFQSIDQRSLHELSFCLFYFALLQPRYIISHLEWEPATCSRRAVLRSAARSAPLTAPFGAPSVSTRDLLRFRTSRTIGRLTAAVRKGAIWPRRRFPANFRYYPEWSDCASQSVRYLKQPGPGARIRYKAPALPGSAFEAVALGNNHRHSPGGKVGHVRAGRLTL